MFTLIITATVLQLVFLLCALVFEVKAVEGELCASTIYLNGEVKLFTTEERNSLQDDAIRFCQQFAIGETDCIRIMEYHSTQCPEENVEDISNIPLASTQTYPGSTHMAAAFSRVYAEKAWGDEGLGSGAGSSLRETQAIADYLRDSIPRLGILSFLDAPCGAMLWMPAVLRAVQQNVPSLTYHGIDVVPELISRHQLAFESETSWHFEAKDMAGPSGFDRSFDLVMTRDIFVHLSSTSIRCALNNLIRSNSTYLLATSYPHIQKNTEHVFRHHKPEYVEGEGKLNDGSFREVNLDVPPYSLGPPIESVQELGRIMGLWDLRIIPLYLDEEGAIITCQ